MEAKYDIMQRNLAEVPVSKIWLKNEPIFAKEVESSGRYHLFLTSKERAVVEQFVYEPQFVAGPALSEGDLLLVERWVQWLEANPERQAFHSMAAGTESCPSYCCLGALQCEVQGYTKAVKGYNFGGELKLVRSATYLDACGRAIDHMDERVLSGCNAQALGLFTGHYRQTGRLRSVFRVEENTRKVRLASLNDARFDFEVIAKVIRLEFFGMKPVERAS